MRVAPIVAGSILLVIGLAAVVGGGMMREAGDWCVATRCADSEALFVGMVGNGVFMGGAFAGLAGTALVVVGVLAEPREERRVLVATGPASRACPSCEAPGAADARYCAACGAAVAPTLRA